MIYLSLSSTLVLGVGERLHDCHSFLPVLCFESFSYLTAFRCHCGTAYLRLEKFLWFKAVKIIAADDSVRWLVTSVSPPQEMRNLPSKDLDASEGMFEFWASAMGFIEPLTTVIFIECLLCTKPQLGMTP